MDPLWTGPSGLIKAPISEHQAPLPEIGVLSKLSLHMFPAISAQRPPKCSPALLPTNTPSRALAEPGCSDVRSGCPG
jgi:hypothetical protein